MVSRTYANTKLSYLFPNSSLHKNHFKDAQKNIDLFVNKKTITKGNYKYISFNKGGAATENLFFKYLGTKLAWLGKMAHIERMAFLNPSMSIPQWARPILDILHHYNYRLSYLLMSGLADIKQAIHILDRHHLYFWSQVFSEYSLVCSLIDSDDLRDFHKNINQRSYDQKISSQK